MLYPKGAIVSWENIAGRYAMRWIVDDALARTPHNGIWVEVGVALGKGIAYMGHVLREAGREDVKLYAIDPWGGYARNGEQQATGSPSRHGDWQLFLESMRDNAPETLARLHIIRAKSFDASCMFMKQTVSLCIIDADHAYEAIQEDLYAWAPTIAPGGIIGGDDHVPDFPGVERACVDYFGKNYQTSDGECGWTTWRARRHPAGSAFPWISREQLEVE